ncbi:MAG: cytochrome c maturation protein CcmE [Gammaproteobacteria bacterium]
MHPERKKRLLAIVLLLIGCFTAVALMLQAFQENLMYFYSPSEIAAGKAPDNRDFRIGGMVVKGSVMRDADTLQVYFTLTDTAKEVTVSYNGILPDLFREGQGIVANGRLDRSGVFRAAEVLAKHDENYMPPEVADALDKAGYQTQEQK